MPSLYALGTGYEAYCSVTKETGRDGLDCGGPLPGFELSSVSAYEMHALTSLTAFSWA
jgi:hypothetical protein